MRLDFNVLWIDDQPDNVAVNQALLARRTESEGFRLQVERARSLQEALPFLADDVFRDNIDLVLVDYNLGVAEMGDVVVRAVRQQVPYKDIVFYSSIPTAELKRMVLTDGVEGVFCAHREDLSETLIGVFESLVKKVLDLDHCRGIVMGVTSDIDHIVLESLLALLPKLDQKHRQMVLEYVISKLETARKNVDTTIAEVTLPGGIEGLMSKHNAFTAVHRLGLLKKILGLHFPGQHSELNTAIVGYIKDIPPKRNKLGHVRISVSGSVRSFRGESAAEFSVEELRQLRQVLIRYRDTFDNLPVVAGITGD